MIMFNFKNHEVLFCFLLPAIYLVIVAQGHPKILGLWEGSVIYNAFNPTQLPNYLPVIQKGGDSVGGHGFGYFLLNVTRVVADYFGHSISVIKSVPLLYGAFTLLILYLVVRRWFDWKVAYISVILLMTNQYFIVMSRELVSSSVLSTMLIFMLIERYQSLDLGMTKWKVVSFGFVCAISATNYIVVRWVMVSIFVYYLANVNQVNSNTNNNKKDNRVVAMAAVLLSMVLFLLLFYPLNIIYLFNSNFLFPSAVGEYTTSIDSVLTSVHYNVLYIVKYFVLGVGKENHSTDLFVKIPYPLESIFIYCFVLIGIVYSFINLKDRGARFLLYLTSVLFFLSLMSEVHLVNDYGAFESRGTINQYRIFSLTAVFSVFGALGIISLSDRLVKVYKSSNVVVYSMLFVVILLRISLFFDENSYFNQRIDEFIFDPSIQAIAKDNLVSENGLPINNDMPFDLRKDYHKNQIYFYKLANYIKDTINHNNIEKGLIVINSDHYTPDFYRKGGGDIPWKGHPYYFQMYLTFYLNEAGINTSYLVAEKDIRSSILKHILFVVDRYELGLTPPGKYPSNAEEVRNVIVARRIIDFIRSYSVGQRLVDSIKGKAHYYNNVPKYGSYYLNPTGKHEPDYVIVVNKEERKELIESGEYQNAFIM